MDAHDRYLTPLQTIAYIKAPSLIALYRMVQRRQVPFTRRGRRLIFDRQALDRWLAKRSVPAVA